MFALLCFVLAILASPFKLKSRFEAENVALRHQLIVLRRKVRGRARLTNNDRWLVLYPAVSMVSVDPAGPHDHPSRDARALASGRLSRSLGGRPQIGTDLRVLIRRISIENPLWGAPRIHGEPGVGFRYTQRSAIVWAAGLPEIASLRALAQEGLRLRLLPRPQKLSMKSSATA